LGDKSKYALATFLVLASLTACGPRRVALPTGAGTPASNFAEPYAAARAACESVRTIQAELGLSGRAAGQRLRGRVLAGIVPGALRLEGIAPFGGPVFILVADGARGTLLLARERRVVRDAPPEEILDALVGVRLSPDDLRAVLAGCAKAVAEAVSAQSHGEDWLAIAIASGGTIYLHRSSDGTWRIVAARYGDLAVDYVSFSGGRPSAVAVRGRDVDVVLAVSQVEINADLPRDRLVALTVPDGVMPLTVTELRRAGPLGP
jgi:hypothetical protein